MGQSRSLSWSSVRRAPSVAGWCVRAIELGPPRDRGGPGPAASSSNSALEHRRRGCVGARGDDRERRRRRSGLPRCCAGMAGRSLASSMRCRGDSGSRPPDRSPDRRAAPNPRRGPAAAPRGSAPPDPAARRGEARRQLRAHRRPRQRSAVVRTTASARSLPRRCACSPACCTTRRARSTSACRCCSIERAGARRDAVSRISAPNGRAATRSAGSALQLIDRDAPRRVRRARSCALHALAVHDVGGVESAAAATTTKRAERFRTCARS